MEYTQLPADPAQRRTLANLARFFAALLVFTLLARGVSGAVMPTVTVQRPAAGSVSKSLQATGTVAAVGGQPFTLPAGLLVTQVPVRQGQKVAQGDVLAVLDADEVQRAIDEKQAEFDKLTLQIAQLQKGAEADAFALGQAQQQLQRAYRETEKVWDEGEEAVRQAQEALRDAAPEAEAEARAALEAAEAAAEANNDAARAAAENAEAARDSALHSYQKEAEQLADANALDRADAAVLSAQRETLQAELEALNRLQANGCQYLAPSAGTITALQLAAGQPSPAVGGLLAGEEALCTLELPLTKEQAALVTVGTTLKVTQGTLTGDAVVTALSAPDADGAVTATAALPQAAWQSGAATAAATVYGTRQEFVLPATAILQDSGGLYVLAAQEQDTVLGLQDVLVRLPVTMEEQGDTTVAVAGALSTDTQVVTAFNKPVQAGSRVRLDE